MSDRIFKGLQKELRVAKHSQVQEEQRELLGPPSWCPPWAIGLALITVVALVVWVSAIGGTL